MMQATEIIRMQHKTILWTKKLSIYCICSVYTILYTFIYDLNFYTSERLNIYTTRMILAHIKRLMGCLLLISLINIRYVSFGSIRIWDNYMVEDHKKTSFKDPAHKSISAKQYYVDFRRPSVHFLIAWRAASVFPPFLFAQIKFYGAGKP